MTDNPKIVTASSIEEIREIFKKIDDERLEFKTKALIEFTEKYSESAAQSIKEKGLPCVIICTNKDRANILEAVFKQYIKIVYSPVISEEQMFFVWEKPGDWLTPEGKLSFKKP